MADPLYGRREQVPAGPPRTRVAQAIFLATRGRKHPSNGGEHWHTTDRMLELLPELRRPVKDSADLTAHEKARIFLSTRLSVAGAMQPVLLAEQLLEALAENGLEVVHRAG